ncbi:hypothetical protein BJ875DRAFT_187291 [Amylocarpus encephaloides]|uniref:Zn(2)-C6 fungal-type domain-containing protein n=1 Tax=Amylocarpus encephaloides TaxID=45428 RepID=A0A9P7YAM1_9HELO|nr:hypothetical protein BJ875DRAFT_187291 [Amylocarpus encephaloides]
MGPIPDQQPERNMQEQGDPKRDTARRTTSRANGQRLTRRRIPLSCIACRARKLKCNREKPCQNCLVRGEANAASCTYAEKVEKKGSGRQNPRSDAEDMRKRLNRLENSILSMIDTKSPRRGASPDSQEAEVDVVPKQAGGQLISADTRSTHWDAILSELGAMKDAWSEENDKIEYVDTEQNSSKNVHRPSLLNGLNPPPDRATLLSSLPPREEATKVITRFFDAYSPSIPAAVLFHRATFEKQCERHWSNPSSTPIIWIGLLYGVLCFAMQSYIRNNDIPPEYETTCFDTGELYRVRAAQCIQVADITKPTEFMVEALNTYAIIEYTSERDGDMGTWLLCGIIVRLALHQGYHRDPSEHPHLTVLQGEMRRRVWCMVSQHELIFSCQVGLAKSIRYAESDTLLPRNVHEEELFEEMTQLPPSRPLTEPTWICYQVVKASIMRGYGRVLEFVHLLQPQPYEEVLRLDLNLMQARETIPDHLQFRSLEEMKNDPPHRNWERYNLQHFYHKAICVLHRKFWDSAPEGTPKGTFYYSRKTCVTSALNLLRYQELIHRGCRPNGPLVGIKWYKFAITNHDFLLAAMILCLDVLNMRKILGSNIPDCVITEGEKLSAIQQSRQVWGEVLYECRDAPRAVKILDTVLSRVSAQKSFENAINMERPQQPQAPIINENPNSLGFNQGFNHQLAFEVPASSGAQEHFGTQDTFMDLMQSDLSVPADFNWDVWDQVMIIESQQKGVSGAANSFGFPTDFQPPVLGL